MCTSIIFWDFYNSNIGGIERLIMTLTEELSQYKKVKIIGKKKGAVYKSLVSSNTPFTFINEEENDFYLQIENTDLFIIFGTYRNFVKLRKSNPSILLWRVYPSLCLNSKIQKILMLKTFNYLKRKQALYFMDTVNWQTVSEELALDLPKNILPIPIKRQNINLPYIQPNDNFFNITYVGRGNEIWKIKPVKKLMQDIAKHKMFNFKLHVFTDSSELFTKELAEINAPNVNVEYLFGYYGENLSKELLKRANIHYSMGTAALEGASLGIPTLIADASFNDFPIDYKYRWITDDLNNYAGIFITSEFKSYGYDLIDIFNQLSNKQEAKRLSLDTKKKIESKFKTSIIVKEILSNQSSAKLSGVLKFMPSYWKSLFKKDSFE